MIACTIDNNRCKNAQTGETLNASRSTSIVLYFFAEKFIFVLLLFKYHLPHHYIKPNTDLQ